MGSICIVHCNFIIKLVLNIIKLVNKSLTDECDPAGSHSSAAALWLLNAHALAWLSLFSFKDD